MNRLMEQGLQKRNQMENRTRIVWFKMISERAAIYDPESTSSK